MGAAITKSSKQKSANWPGGPRCQVGLMPDGGGSSLLGLPAQKSRDVEIVGRNIWADFADVLLHLVDDIRQRLLHGRFGGFASRFPGLGQERLFLVHVFL